MSELAGLISSLRSVALDPEKDAAAVRAVMLRVDNGQLDHAGARRVLEALGLIDAPSGGSYTPWGARTTKDRPRKRAQVAADGSALPGVPDDAEQAT